MKCSHNFFPIKFLLLCYFRLKTTLFCLFCFVFFGCSQGKKIYLTAITLCMNYTVHWWFSMSWKCRSHINFVTLAPVKTTVLFLTILKSTSGWQQVPTCITCHGQLQLLTKTKQTNLYYSLLLIIRLQDTYHQKQCHWGEPLAGDLSMECTHPPLAQSPNKLWMTE